MSHVQTKIVQRMGNAVVFRTVELRKMYPCISFDCFLITHLII